jgi:hypothetical protein
LSDISAGDAALRCDVDDATIQTIAWLEATAACIRARAVAALVDACEKDPRPAFKEPKEGSKKPEPPIKANIAASSHRVSKSGSLLSCDVCHTSASVHDPTKWLASSFSLAAAAAKRNSQRQQQSGSSSTSPAVGFFIPAKAGQPQPPPARGPVEVPVLAVARQQIHATHAPIWQEDMQIFYCEACGAVGAEALRALAKPCKPVRTRSGQQNLQRIARGHYPGSSLAAKAFNADRIQFKPRR